MLSVLPASRASIQWRVRGERMAEVGSYSRQWACLLPQHGAGPKHRRAIALEGWQSQLVKAHPFALLRGLIHSDGCRGANTIRHRTRSYVYPRYQFSNRSDDIRALFCDACDRAGVDWRQMNRWTISVARRASVARLDAAGCGKS